MVAQAEPRAQAVLAHNRAVHRPGQWRQHARWVSDHRRCRCGCSWRNNNYRGWHKKRRRCYWCGLYGKLRGRTGRGWVQLVRGQDGVRCRPNFGHELPNRRNRSDAGTVRGMAWNKSIIASERGHELWVCRQLCRARYQGSYCDVADHTLAHPSATRLPIGILTSEAAEFTGWSCGKD